MKTGTTFPEGCSSPARDAGYLNRLAKRIILARLSGLQLGELIINDGDTQHSYGTTTPDFPAPVTMTVTDRRFYDCILLRGALGAGEAYMNGYWRCDDLTGFVRLFLRNRSCIGNIESGSKWLGKPLQLLQRWLQRNTLKGSRRNIEAHYDLGNELFELFLDKSMMYSCGIFRSPDDSLRTASENKLETICRKLQLKADDHVLEIGTGWGGFALYAAEHYGCRVTTTTISRQQHDYAQQRIRDAGLEDRITLLFKDYRELDGSYDKLVSIEMIEAIGHRYFDTYFEQCGKLLKPNGMMLLQTITIADQRFDSAKNSVDFIQRYIFPGGCLPSVAALGSSIAQTTDMRIFHLEDIGPHYATTLKMWRERLFRQLDKVRSLGYPERFIRMWEYYLTYCEGGFREQVIGTAQLLLVKPQCRRNPLSSTDHQASTLHS